MLQELKKYSSAGDRAGILYFSHVVMNEPKINIGSAESFCLINQDIRLDFNCISLLFQDLEILSVEEDSFIPKDGIYNAGNLKSYVHSLCTRCFYHLLADQMISIDKFSYNEDEGLFYAPKKSFKLASSVYRNLLVELGAMAYVEENIQIDPEFENIFANEINKIKVSRTQQQLLDDLKRKEEQGEKGELFALKYEKVRCNFTAEQVKKIRQISKIAVSAGYDIISFNSPSDVIYNRRIEVKTYQGQPHFYWSENEINVARMAREEYYIYLVDYDRIEEPGYQPVLIQNPYKVIVENKEWNMKPNSFYVSQQISS